MTKKCTFITQFNRDRNSICNCNVVKFEKPSMVKESLSYAVDINTIYNNYCKTGKLPLNGNQPIYDENFINYDNLIEAQEAVREASSYFQTLPSEIRNQYGNDLGKFVKAIHSNDKFLIEKGVLKKIELKKTEVNIEPSKLSPSDIEKSDLSVVPSQIVQPTDVSSNTVKTDNL